jgi:poly-gamma-glutamate synthesis protein (capsule biosynthesis protein)
MLGRNVETLMNTNGSDYPYTQLSLKSLSNNPAVVGNFEAAVATKHRQTPSGVMRFSIDQKHLADFGANFTHASLANNHSLDYGTEGYLNAVSLLEQSSVDVFGHNTLIDSESIAYIEADKGRVAIIGVNASQHIPTETEIESVCQVAKRKSDFQVIYIHWGDEYEPVHSETQRVLAEALVDACADLVIGHHPHVVQDVDVIKGVLVFYSLGNYIFDQYFSSEVKEGLVLALEFNDVPAVRLIPVSSSETKSVPKVVDAALAQDFMEKLANRSHPSLKKAIAQGQINLIEPVATSTKMAIMSR